MNKEKNEERKNKREFLKKLGFIGSMLGLSALYSSISFLFSKTFASSERKNGTNKNNGKGERKHKWGMVIDLDLCTGCGACVIACKVENNVPFVEDDEEMEGAEISWMYLLPVDERIPYLPLPCFHCDNPPCTKVCPVNATYINEEGIVAQIWDRCIGCRYCQVACPYERKYFGWKDPHFPETYKQWFNPDVATRPEGVVEKCTFCYHRLRKVKHKAKDEGREIRDEEVRYLPACAESCPTRAIVFGDLNNPDSLVSQLSRDPRAFRLFEHLGTEPKVFYLSKEKRRYTT